MPYFCASMKLCNTIWIATLISSSLTKSRRCIRAWDSAMRTMDSICRTVTGTLPVTSDSRRSLAYSWAIFSWSTEVMRGWILRLAYMRYFRKSSWGIGSTLNVFGTTWTWRTSCRTMEERERESRSVYMILLSVVVVGRWMVTHVALRDESSHQFILDQMESTCACPSNDAFLYLDRISNITNGAQNIETCENRFWQVDVVHKCQGWIISAAHRIGCSDDWTARLKRGHDTRFGYRDALLFHGFVNRCSILVGHLKKTKPRLASERNHFGEGRRQVYLVELVNQTNAAISLKEQRMRLSRNMSDKRWNWPEQVHRPRVSILWSQHCVGRTPLDRRQTHLDPWWKRLDARSFQCIWEIVT